MTLNEVADSIEAEWYGTPRVRDWHRGGVIPECSEVDAGGSANPVAPMVHARRVTTHTKQGV